jgi:hypothetical protein
VARGGTDDQVLPVEDLAARLEASQGFGYVAGDGWFFGDDKLLGPLNEKFRKTET